MYAKLSIPERLKDLRVVDKHLTLEQLAEQTGLSKSALGKYETDDYKDISPFAIATLADFYGVSTDYLMGLTENKNQQPASLRTGYPPELPASDDRYGNLHRPDRQYAGGTDESGDGSHPAKYPQQIFAWRR